MTRCGDIVSQSPEDQTIDGECIDPSWCDRLGWCKRDGEYSEPNCLMGHRVHNPHNNCPYSLLCATCDMDDDEGQEGSDSE